MNYRISLCKRTPEGRLLEDAVCSLENGEAKWLRLSPEAGPALKLALDALEVIPHEDPAVTIQEENS